MATVADKITILRRRAKDIPVLTGQKFDGDNSSVAFRTKHAPIVEDSYTLKISTAVQVEDTDYTGDLDSGLFQFTSAPASGDDNVIINYKYANLRDIEWLQLINDVIIETEEKLWSEAIDESTLTTVANQDDYDLSAIDDNIIMVLGVWYKKSTDTQWQDLSKATNVRFMKEQNKLNLNPVLDVDDYQIRVRYLKAQDTYDATSDTWAFPEKYFPALTALARLKYLDEFMLKTIQGTGAKVTSETYEGLNGLNSLRKSLEREAEKMLARAKPVRPSITIPTIIQGKKS